MAQLNINGGNSGNGASLPNGGNSGNGTYAEQRPTTKDRPSASN